MNVSSSGPCNRANIFLGLIEYERNSLPGASHLVDYVSVHIRFDLEIYLLNSMEYKNEDDYLERLSKKMQQPVGSPNLNILPLIQICET